jgi:cellulose synthase/poly-beta-1,6-N-acetylglucosamine synthase-like glycosyltransferase
VEDYGANDQRIMNILFLTSLLVIFYSYFGYPALLYLISRFYHRQRIVDEQNRPFISMVISAFNEQETLPKKIENCHQLDYPNAKLEILIGSDGSDDKTDEILNASEDNVIQPFIFKTRRGKAGVVNELVARARGTIIVFSDANTIYDPNALKHMMKHFTDKNVGGVCGRLCLTNPDQKSSGQGESLYWKYETQVKKWEGCIRTVIGANGAIYAIRKNLYTPLSTRKILVDDFVISLKVVQAGYDVIFDNEAVAFETTSPRIRGEFKRKIRIGVSNFNSIAELKSLLNPSRGFAAFGFWSHKIIRWFIPFFFLSAFISNLFLLHATLFKITMALQVMFYLLAGLGCYLDMRTQCPKLLLIPYYLCAVNLGLLLGFFKFLRGSQKLTWGRVERI